MQRIMGFSILITHKSKRSENLITWVGAALGLEPLAVSHTRLRSSLGQWRFLRCWPVDQGSTPLKQAALPWIQFQSCRLEPLVNSSAASTCHRSTSYGWLCHLDRSEGLLMAYHLTLAPWIFQRLPMHWRTETTLQFVFWTLSFACLSRAFPSASSHWTIGGSSATAPCKWVRSVRHLSSVWDTSHSQHFLVCNSVVHT